MRWRFFKKATPPVPPPAEGKAAFDRAVNKMAEIDDRWPEVHAAADPLKRHMAENHFADQILNIFAGRRK